MFNFFPTSEFKWIDPKDFDSNKYCSNSSIDYILQVDFEYPKELRELHHNYLLAPDKIEIKREMLSKYQFMISDFYSITTGNVRRLVANVFDKEKYVFYYQKL